MGTPYFETILVKVPNRALIEKALRDQILAVDGVTAVSYTHLDVYKRQRAGELV